MAQEDCGRRKSGNGGARLHHVNLPEENNADLTKDAKEKYFIMLFIPSKDDSSAQDAGMELAGRLGIEIGRNDIRRMGDKAMIITAMLSSEKVDELRKDPEVQNRCFVFPCSNMF